MDYGTLKRIMEDPWLWEDLARRNKKLSSLCILVAKYIRDKQRFVSSAPVITREAGWVFTDMVNIIHEYLSVLRREYKMEPSDEETVVRELRQMVKELTSFDRRDEKAIVVPIEFLKAIEEGKIEKMVRLFGIYASKFDGLVVSKIYIPLVEALSKSEDFVAKQFAKRSLASCGIFIKEVAMEKEKEGGVL